MIRMLSCAAVCLWVCGATVRAAAPQAAATPASSATQFDARVAPILAAHCTKCHGAEKQESGLRLDSAAAVRTGGYSGPAVVPGKSSASILIQVVTGKGDLSAMPPKGPRLTAADVATLAEWIDAGAPAGAAPAASATADVSKKSDHWAFQPVRAAQPPGVKNERWVRNPIDRFVLARLEASGLEPSAEADRGALLRRLSLDLVGLPPTPAESYAFLFDNSPDAYEKVVDRLLASPHYGERWGRHWLDAARYADSNGYTIDSGRSIWKYRDYVINALNADLPFDRFTIEQIAGDMLPEATLEQKIATGFHRNTLVNEEGGTDKEQFRVEAVVDRVSTVGTVWLGLTVGCARCHDHKYDPLSQREFYQLYSLLNNCEEPTLSFPTEHQAREEPALLAEIAQVKKRLDDVLINSPGRRREWERTVRNEIAALRKNESTPEVLDLLADFATALDTPEEKRSDEQKKLIDEKFRPNDVERNVLEPQLTELQAKLKQLKAKITTTLVVREMAAPRPAFIHVRGDFLRVGASVTPGALAVLPELKPAGAQATRLDLARWLVDGRNPLTPRVTVNRIWQQYFGAGLVATENDFGAQGDRPTHPELLDWLADALRSGADRRAPRPWSLKQLHRLIVTSAVYRQSSAARADLAAKDPYNKLLGRQARIRLEAETIRDAALAAAGLLDASIGGPGVYPPQPEGIYAFTQQRKFWQTSAGGDRYRRGMYTYFWRSSPYPFLMTFDAPDANAACTRRIRSNTPLQALTLANDRAFVEMAAGVARRVLAEGSRSEAERTSYAFRLCLAREPNSVEAERLARFVAAQRAAFSKDPAAAAALLSGDPSPTAAAGAATGAQPATGAKAATEPTPTADPQTIDTAAWTAAARVLLNLDEFITRE